MTYVNYIRKVFDGGLNTDVIVPFSVVTVSDNINVIITYSVMERFMKKRISGTNGGR